jgi:hypothetical protein
VKEDEPTMGQDFTWRDVVLFVVIAAVGFGVVTLLLNLFRRSRPARAERRCPDPACGRSNEVTDRFCRGCGRPLDY